MKKIILLLSLSAIFVPCSGQNTNISNYTFLDSEPTLAVSPANNNILIAAWMKATAANQITIAYASSSDAGVTWTSPVLMPHLWPSFTHADVSITFSGAGIAYICYIDYQQNLDSGYVMVAKSANGGVSWNTAVKVTSALEKSDLPVDRPWVAVDNSSGPFGGRIYVTSKGYFAAPLPHHVWLKSSSDGGSTWSAIKQIDDSIPTDLVTNSMGVPTVGPDGNLYIAYASYHTAESVYARMICSKSTDGGSHFIPYPIANFAANSAITDTLYQGSYVLSSNPVNSTNLILSFTDARSGDPDILSVHSLDGGLTWNTTPVRVNDDVPGNGVGQDMCWGGFNAQGNYVVAWRDRRNGGTTSTSNFEVYAASSANGSIFGANVKLSSAQSPSINMRRGNDFIGVCLTNSYVYSDWSDRRTGNDEIFFDNTQLSTLTGLGIAGQKTNAISLQCYPNPNTGKMNVIIYMPEAGKVNLRIFDLTGKLIRNIPVIDCTCGQNNFPLDISSLSSGHYFMKVSDGHFETEQNFEKTGN
jgi:hypothetical protein